MAHQTCQGRGTEPRHAGFTLVELLVVIAIIGILAGLIIPVVQSSRDKALEAACANNVRQIAMACRMYAERKGTFPWPQPPGGGKRLSELATDADVRACLELLYIEGYVDDPALFVCPGAKGIDVPAEPIEDPAERRRSFRLSEENCSYTYRKRLTTDHDGSLTPLLADRRGGEADGPTNHRRGRNVAYVGSNVCFVEAAALAGEASTRVKRMRDELLGFD